MSLDLQVPESWPLCFAEVWSAEFEGLPPMFDPSAYRRLWRGGPSGFRAFGFGNNAFSVEFGSGTATISASFLAYPEDGGLVADKESSALLDFAILLRCDVNRRGRIHRRKHLLPERSWAIAYPIPLPVADEEEVAGRAEDAWFNYLKNGG